MKKIILLLLVLSSCCDCHENRGRVLYKDSKCTVIQVNDSTLILAPGYNSEKGMEAKTVFINRKGHNN
jgi:hypothetical protein